MSISDEGGLRNHRTEFVRENVDSNGDPETPTDPSFVPYSDTIRSFEWSPSTGVEAERGIGNPDPENHEKGPEEHQITVVYDLQQWFIDGTGDPLDAAYDGLVRTTGNKLPNTHTVVDREDKFGIAEVNTVDGSSGSKDTRIFTVGRGGGIGSAAVTGDPSDQQPVAVELGYEFERVRSFQVDQPSTGTMLDVVSSDGSDDSQTLTIEDEDAGTTEDVSLNGTTTVTTTESFSNIDALELDAETVGDVTVSVTGAEDLAVLRGSAYYDDVEGDAGIPALGTGSHGGVVGSSYETILGDTITRGGGALAMDINSKAIEVENNIERTVREASFGQRLHVGNRDTTVTSTVVGETESHDKILESLATTESDIVWTFDGGTVTVPNAVLMDPGGRTVEAGQASMTLDQSFDGKGVTIA